MARDDKHADAPWGFKFAVQGKFVIVCSGAFSVSSVVIFWWGFDMLSQARDPMWALQKEIIAGTENSIQYRQDRINMFIWLCLADSIMATYFFLIQIIRVASIYQYKGKLPWQREPKIRKRALGLFIIDLMAWLPGMINWFFLCAFWFGSKSVNDHAAALDSWVDRLLKVYETAWEYDGSVELIYPITMPEPYFLQGCPGLGLTVCFAFCTCRIFTFERHFCAVRDFWRTLRPTIVWFAACYFIWFPIAGFFAILIYFIEHDSLDSTVERSFGTVFLSLQHSWYALVTGVGTSEGLLLYSRGLLIILLCLGYLSIGFCTSLVALGLETVVDTKIQRHRLQEHERELKRRAPENVASGMQPGFRKNLFVTLAGILIPGYSKLAFAYCLVNQVLTWAFAIYAVLQTDESLVTLNLHNWYVDTGFLVLFGADYMLRIISYPNPRRRAFADIYMIFEAISLLSGIAIVVLVIVSPTNCEDMVCDSCLDVLCAFKIFRLVAMDRFYGFIPTIWTVLTMQTTRFKSILSKWLFVFVCVWFAVSSVFVIILQAAPTPQLDVEVDGGTYKLQRDILLDSCVTGMEVDPRQRIGYTRNQFKRGENFECGYQATWDTARIMSMTLLGLLGSDVAADSVTHTWASQILLLLIAPLVHIWRGFLIGLVAMGFRAVMALYQKTLENAQQSAARTIQAAWKSYWNRKKFWMVVRTAVVHNMYHGQLPRDNSSFGDHALDRGNTFDDEGEHLSGELSLSWIHQQSSHDPDTRRFIAGSDPTMHDIPGSSREQLTDAPGGMHGLRQNVSLSSDQPRRNAHDLGNRLQQSKQSIHSEDDSSFLEPEVIQKPKRSKMQMLRNTVDILDTFYGKVAVATIIALSTFFLLLESQAEANMTTPSFDRFARGVDIFFGVIFFLEWIMRCTSALLKSRAKFVAYLISFTGVCDFLGSFFWPYLFSDGGYGRMSTNPVGWGVTYMYRAFKLARFYSICCPSAARGLWARYWRGASKPLFSLMASFIIIWILLACALYNMEKSSLANDTRRVFPSLKKPEFSDRFLANGDANPTFISDSWIWVCSRRFYLQILPALSFETMAFRRSGHAHSEYSNGYLYKPMSVAQSLGTSRKILEFQRLLHQQAWDKLAQDQNWQEFIKADLDKDSYQDSLENGDPSQIYARPIEQEQFAPGFYKEPVPGDEDKRFCMGLVNVMVQDQFTYELEQLHSDDDQEMGTHETAGQMKTAHRRSDELALRHPSAAFMGVGWHRAQHWYLTDCWIRLPLYLMGRWDTVLFFGDYSSMFIIGTLFIYLTN